MKLVRLIFSLFYSGSPATVLFGVIAFIVNPINRKVIGFFTHIFQEISEVIFPSFTYFDSLSPIPFKIFPFCICTSFYHISPALISWTRIISSRMTMRFRHFFFTTFALSRFTSAKFSSRNNENFSTFTLTLPKRSMFGMIRNQLNNIPTSKSLLRHVFVIFSQINPFRIVNQTIHKMVIEVN